MGSSNRSLEPDETYVLQPGQRLSDSTLVVDVLADGGDVVIEARTGIGKSYGLIEGLKTAGVPFVFAADTKLLAGQLASKHALPLYWAGAPEPDDEVSFVTVYNHVDRFADARFVLVVDEFHSLIADAGWKAEVIEGMISAFDRYRQVIGLTGTFIAPIPKFRLVRVTQRTPPLAVDIDGRRDVIGAIADAVVKEDGHIHAVLVQDKSKVLSGLLSALEKRGVSKETVLVLNSKTLATAQATELMETGVLPETTRVLITTIRQGYSVYRAKGSVYEDGVVVHLFPTNHIQHSASEMAQMAARFREPDVVTALRLYQRYDSPTSLADIPTWDEIIERQMKEVYNQQRFWYETFFKVETFDPTVVPVEWDEYRKRAVVMMPYGFVSKHADPNKMGLLLGDLSPNWYRINQAALENETEAIHQSVDRLDRALRRYNLRVGEYQKPSGTEVESKYGRKDAKEAREARWVALVDELFNAPIGDFPLYDDDAEILLGLRGRFPDETVKEIALRKEHVQDLNLLRDRIAVLSPKQPIDRQWKTRVENSFNIGDRYEGDVIRRKLNAIHRQHGLLKTSTLKSNGKAIRLLKQYFDVRGKQNPSYIPGDSSTGPKRLYEICGLALGTPTVMRFWADTRRWWDASES